jgi:phosphoserine aminotransferase
VDALTYCWQKCLGSEAVHGMLILNPMAIQRMETYNLQWSLPKVFRVKKGGKIDKAIFDGEYNKYPFHDLRGGPP